MRGEPHVYGRIIGDKMLAVCMFYWNSWKPLFYLFIHNFLQCLLKINWYQAREDKQGSVFFYFLCLTKMKIICLQYFWRWSKSCQRFCVSHSHFTSSFFLSLSLWFFNKCYKYICIYIYIILHGCLVTQSCPTLFNPVDCSLPGSSVHGDSPGKNTGVMYIDKHIYTYIYAYLFFLLLKTSLYEAFEIEKKWNKRKKYYKNKWLFIRIFFCPLFFI